MARTKTSSCKIPLYDANRDTQPARHAGKHKTTVHGGTNKEAYHAYAIKAVWKLLPTAVRARAGTDGIDHSTTAGRHTFGTRREALTCSRRHTIRVPDQPVHEKGKELVIGKQACDRVSLYTTRGLPMEMVECLKRLSTSPKLCTISATNLFQVCFLNQHAP